VELIQHEHHRTHRPGTLPGTSKQTQVSESKYGRAIRKQGGAKPKQHINESKSAKEKQHNSEWTPKQHDSVRPNTSARALLTVIESTGLVA
jgi:hypothetical protein